MRRVLRKRRISFESDVLDTILMSPLVADVLRDLAISPYDTMMFDYHKKKPCWHISIFTTSEDDMLRTDTSHNTNSLIVDVFVWCVHESVNDTADYLIKC